MTVFTDHSACVSVLGTARPAGKKVCWALTMQELNLTLKHCSGKLNSNADALSRNPVLDSCLVGSHVDSTVSPQGSGVGVCYKC